MKTGNILMTGVNVRAIREDRKTHTRRVMNPQPVGQLFSRDGFWVEAALSPKHRTFTCPYGQPGDLLNVKEAAWMWCEQVCVGQTERGNLKWSFRPLRSAPVHYVADHPARPTLDVVSPDTGNVWRWRYKAARFLPAWAVRLTLKLESVRVERVQDITEEDGQAEGVAMNANLLQMVRGQYPTFKEGFRKLWNEINAERGHGWEKNEWVWVLTFSRVEGGQP